MIVLFDIQIYKITPTRQKGAQSRRGGHALIIPPCPRAFIARGIYGYTLQEDSARRSKTLGIFFVGILYGDIVVVGRTVLLGIDHMVLEVDKIIFMHRIYHNPGIFLIKPGTGRHDSLQKMVELVLPYLGKIVFFFS